MGNKSTFSAFRPIPKMKLDTLEPPFTSSSSTEAAREQTPEREPEALPTLWARSADGRPEAGTGPRRAPGRPCDRRQLQGRVEDLQQQKAALDAQLTALITEHEQQRSLASWRKAQAGLRGAPMRQLC